MPILSTYTASSEKSAVSRANAAPRAGADETKTRFSSLLDAITPSAISSKESDGSKTSDKSAPVEKSSSAERSKADSVRKKKASSQKADEKDADPKTKTDQPEEKDVSPEQPADLSDKNEIPTDDQTTAASDEIAEDTAVVLSQEPIGDALISEAILTMDVAVANPQPAQPVDDGATDDAIADTMEVKPQAVSQFVMAAPVEAAAVAVQNIQAAPIDPNTQTTLDESSSASTNTPVQPAQVDIANVRNTVDPMKASTESEQLTGNKPAGKLTKAELKTADQSSEIQGESSLSAEEIPLGDEFGKVLEKMLPREAVEGNARVVQAPAGPGASAEGAVAAQSAQANMTNAMEENQDRIVTAVQSQISAKGGTMRIRLDPPELGAMQVKVEMRGEMVSATFLTSNDHAAKMLTHGLGHLKTVLERQGLSVDRLQVQTTRNDAENGGMGDPNNGSSTAWQGYENQQDQQRRQTLNQMWRRAAVGRDPLDMVA